MRCSFSFVERRGLVALWAREVEDEFRWLVFRFLVDGAMGMEELIGDVGENSGAAGRDAPLGDLRQEAGEEFLDVLAVKEVGRFGEEVGGEIGGVARRRRKNDCGIAQAEMMPAEAGLRF